MAEHVDKSAPEGQATTAGDDGATQALPQQQHAAPQQQGVSQQNGTGAETRRKRRAESSVDWSKAKDQIVGLLSAVVRWLGVIFAVILVLHVIFVLGEANGDNGIVTFADSWSKSLSMGFEDLFTPDDHKLEVLVNYGIAAIFWLVVSAIVSKIIRRVGDSINV